MAVHAPGCWVLLAAHVVQALIGWQPSVQLQALSCGHDEVACC